VVGKRARDLLSAEERDDEMNHAMGGLETRRAAPDRRA
jgi:hypothetical protein